jgi:outer membrane protein
MIHRLIVLSLALIAPAAFASGAAKSLDECVDLALRNHPAAVASSEALRAASEAVGSARSRYRPALAASLGFRDWESHAFLPAVLKNQIPVDTIGPTEDWSARVTLDYVVFDGGLRHERLRGANEAAGMARDAAAQTREDIAAGVSRAFFGLLSAQEAARVAADRLERSQEHLRLAKTRKEAGAVPQLDVVRSDLEVANARLDLVSARSAVDIAGGALNTAMGLEPGDPIEVQPVVGNLSLDSVPPPERAIADAVAHRAEVEMARRRVTLAESLIGAARAAARPTAAVRASYGWRDAQFLPHDLDWSVGVALDVPLFDGSRTRHDTARAAAEHRQAKADLDREVLAVSNEVWSANAALRSSYETVAQADAARALAQESLRLARARYGAGAGTIADLLDAESALRGAEAAVTRVRYGYQIAWTNYRQAIGSASPR